MERTRRAQNGSVALRPTFWRIMMFSLVVTIATVVTAVHQVVSLVGEGGHEECIELYKTGGTSHRGGRRRRSPVVWKSIDYG